jgi:hypothetical protein
MQRMNCVVEMPCYVTLSKPNRIYHWHISRFLRTQGDTKEENRFRILLYKYMALGSIQPLREMGTRNLPGGKGRPAHKADNLVVNCEPIV